MLRTNIEQRTYYDNGFMSSLRSQGNPSTRLWRALRRKQQDFRSALGIDHELYVYHQQWIGELDGLRVLDLGCYTGNPLSDKLAQESAYYLAVDLSQNAMEKRANDLSSQGIGNAEVLAGDVLSNSFRERAAGQFDLIYAHSVLHHFKHLDVLLEDMRHWLRPGGRVISLDPLGTAWPVRLARAMYRPFQSDRAWEHPFGRAELNLIQDRCIIHQVFGMMGWLKWGFPLYLIIPRLGIFLARRLLSVDRRKDRRSISNALGCMQVSLMFSFDTAKQKD